MTRYARSVVGCLKKDVEKINRVIACCGKDHPEAEKSRESLRSGLKRLGQCFMVFGDPVELGLDGVLGMGQFTLVGRGAGFSVVLAWHKRPPANPSTPFHQVTRLWQGRRSQALRSAAPCCSAAAAQARRHGPAGNRVEDLTTPVQGIGRRFVAATMGRSLASAARETRLIPSLTRRGQVGKAV